MSQRDEITRIPLTIVSTLDGARTDDVLVGVLAADLDALERRAAGLLVPIDMTAEKLREIAAWIDTHDELGHSYLDLLDRLDKRGVATGTTVTDRLVARDVLSGKEVQDDLTAWADFLDTQETP